MDAQLRRRHLFMWIGLAPVLLLGVLAVLAVRPAPADGVISAGPSRADRVETAP